MKMISYVALLLLSVGGFVESAVTPPSITVAFDKLGADYRSSVNNQTHKIDDVDFKMFGKHLKTQTKEDGSRYGNGDVKIFNASYSNNDFEKFPELVCELFVNLRDLYMEKTNLQIITQTSFDKCTNVENIYFAEDSITSIDSGVFSSCAKLVTLKFNGNEITEINSNAFEGLKSLETLALIGNNFSEIDPQLFTCLTSLKELTINDQPLKNLPANIFEKLESLEVLNLNNNELEVVLSAWFNNKNLESVDLSSNKIRMIDSNLLKVWSNQASLNLVDNECVDANLGKIGTDLTPIVDVGKVLEICFLAYDDELKVAPIGDDSVVDADDATDVGKIETTSEQAENTTVSSPETDDSDESSGDKVTGTFYSHEVASNPVEGASDSNSTQTTGDENDTLDDEGSDEIEDSSEEVEPEAEDEKEVAPVRDTIGGKIYSHERNYVPKPAQNTTDSSEEEGPNEDEGTPEEAETDETEGSSEEAESEKKDNDSEDETGTERDNKNVTAGDSEYSSEEVSSVSMNSTKVSENSDESDEENTEEESSEEVGGNSFNSTQINLSFETSGNSSFKTSHNSISINSTSITSNGTKDTSDIFEIDDSIAAVPHDENSDESDAGAVSEVPKNATEDDTTETTNVKLTGNSDEDENPMIGGRDKWSNSDDDDFEFPTVNNSSEIEDANKTYAEILTNSKEVKLTEDNFKFPEIVGEDSLSPFDVEEGDDIVEKPVRKDDEETEIVEDVEVKIGSDSKSESVESTEADYKKYEVAQSRFYLSADNKYTAVIYGVSDTMRFINIKHVEGFSNDNVTVVFVRDCVELRHIPAVLFKKFKNLEYLSINKCEINLMGNHFLNECGKLRHLDLRFNKIETVKGESLKNCANLETIDLSDNVVVKIDSDVFECNPELNVIIDSLRIGAKKKKITA